MSPVYQSLLARLLIGTLAIVLLPAILIVSDLYFFEDVRALQGLDLRSAVVLDISSTIIASFFCIYFICRSLTEPLRNLKDVVEEVQDDNLEAKAIPLTDDELGILSGQVNTMIAQIRDRNFIRQTFGRYVPEKVAELILENRDRFTPQVRTATLMFIDIEGFTSLCESYEPKTVAQILNVYFGEVVKIVARNDGVVNHFEGDAMLVTFNVPVVDADHAAKAVRTAVEIQMLLQNFVFPHGERLSCRIGINTGEVIAGVVGPPERAIYTVYGDAVNIASRLEKMNKDFDSRILLTEATEALLPGTERAGFNLLSKGPQVVRGKMDSVVVFEVTPTDFSLS
nr:adenylate/guanylate cyclase domain-containing protein [Sneathiella limimaris]